MKASKEHGDRAPQRIVQYQRTHSLPHIIHSNITYLYWFFLICTFCFITCLNTFSWSCFFFNQMHTFSCGKLLVLGNDIYVMPCICKPSSNFLYIHFHVSMSSYLYASFSRELLCLKWKTSVSAIWCSMGPTSSCHYQISDITVQKSLGFQLAILHSLHKVCRRNTHTHKQEVVCVHSCICLQVSSLKVQNKFWSNFVWESTRKV